ncbi:hypothetical protein HY732_05155 [Candidatus Uhrbacteria bacterium]|nr:hypothetical protein [Candidatus Uhrbacteria bacterium]
MIKNPYFTLQDIRIRGAVLFPSQLTLWKKQGLIDKVKRGIYVFNDRKDGIQKEEIAFLLYGPSYISSESILRKHGLIPEMVYGTTSVTTRTTRRFTNSFGAFIYHHVTPRLFFGYTAHTTPHGKYLLADPEKAMLDYLYLNQDSIDTIDDIDEIRINGERFLEVMDTDKLKEYACAFCSPKIDHLLDILCTYVHA